LAYEPQPIDTSNAQLNEEILELTERLAKNAHDVWARLRLAEGWRYGPRRDEAKKEHPSLIPYEDLPEPEKEYDRNVAMETLKAILALGYRIEGPVAGQSRYRPEPQEERFVSREFGSHWPVAES
jgi:RyR domain